MRSKQDSLFGLMLFWLILTTVFAWLPLVRIIGRPEGYQWGILGMTGEGTQGPYWIFILLTLYVLTMLFSAFRGPRALFYPMLILWLLAVDTVVITGTVLGGMEATWQGQGLRLNVPLWVLVVPCLFFTALAVVWMVKDYRTGEAFTPVAWSRRNSNRLVVSLALLIVALVLFRAGTNYNWVTAAAIITTIIHWILLIESFQPMPQPTRQV